jgi:hypothetical protein
MCHPNKILKREKRETRQTFFSLWAAHPGKPIASEAPTASRSGGVVGETPRPTGALPTPARLGCALACAAAFFRPGGGDYTSGQAGAVKAAAAPSAARGALTEGARCAAILSSPPGRAGLSLPPGRPLGAAGALAPPAAHGSRVGFAAEGEDGDGAGWAGGRTREWAPRAASASRPG